MNDFLVYMGIFACSTIIIALVGLLFYFITQWVEMRYNLKIQDERLDQQYDKWRAQFDKIRELSDRIEKLENPNEELS